MSDEIGDNAVEGAADLPAAFDPKQIKDITAHLAASVTVGLNSTTVKGFLRQCRAAIDTLHPGATRGARAAQVAKIVGNHACNRVSPDLYEHLAQVTEKVRSLDELQRVVYEAFGVSIPAAESSKGHREVLTLLATKQKESQTASEYGRGLATIMGRIQPDWPQQLRTGATVNMVYVILRSVFIRGLRDKELQIALDDDMNRLGTWSELLALATDREGARQHVAGARGGPAYGRGNAVGEGAPNTPVRPSGSNASAAAATAPAGVHVGQEPLRRSARINAPPWAITQLGAEEAERRRVHKECYKCGRKINSPGHQHTSHECTLAPANSHAAPPSN